MKDDKINNLKERLDDAIKDADSIHITIMEKLNDFEKTLKSVEISIAELPDKLTQRFDEKYASKKLEEDVCDLNEKVGDLRDWKIKIVAILSVVMFLFTFLKDPIMKAIGIE